MMNLPMPRSAQTVFQEIILPRSLRASARSALFQVSRNQASLAICDKHIDRTDWRTTTRKCLPYDVCERCTQQEKLAIVPRQHLWHRFEVVI